MEFKKCNRCGNFYMAEGHVCPRCVAKDNREYGIFQTYRQENGLDQTVDIISSATGISEKNINRFIQYEEEQTNPIGDPNLKTSLE